MVATLNKFVTALLLTGCLLAVLLDCTHGDPPPSAAVPGTDLYGDPLPKFARNRLGTVRFRQGNVVSSVRYLPDRKTLLSVGNDSTLRFWEAATGKELHRFTFASNGILSPDGQMVATNEPDQTVKLWDAASGKVIRQFGEPKGNNLSQFAVAFAPDGKTLAVVEVDANNQNGSIRLWDVATGKEHGQLVGPVPKDQGQRFMPSDFSFSQDGKIGVATGIAGNDAHVCLWDLGSLKLLPELSGHRSNGNNGAAVVRGNVVIAGGAESVAMSPDGALVAGLSMTAADDNNNLKCSLWEVATGKLVRDLAKLSGEMHSLCFSPDGRLVAAVEADQATLRRWTVQTGKELDPINAGQNIALTAFAFSPDGKAIAVATTDAKLRLFEAVGGQELRELKNYRGSTPFGQGPVSATSGLGSALAFAADGKSLAVASGSIVQQWRMADGEEVRPNEGGHEGEVFALALAPDGKTLASASDDNTVKLWDVASGKQTRALAGVAPEDLAALPIVGVPFGFPMRQGNSLAFSPDGRLLAGGWWMLGGVVLWETQTGKKVQQLKGNHETGVTSLAFAPNGKFLASGGQDGRAVWWDVLGAKQLRQFAGPLMAEGPGAEDMLPSPTVQVALSPDGRTLAVADMDLFGGDHSGVQIRLFELASGALRRRLHFKMPLDDDGLHGSGIRPGLAAPTPSIGDQSFGITSVRFAPDGKGLIWTAGSTIRLVDLARGKEVRRFGGQEGAVRAAVLAPDGKLLASASDDGTIQLWETATGTVLGQLVGHRGRVSSLVFAGDGKTLYSGGADTSVLTWDVDRFLAEERAAPQTSLPDAQLKVHWTVLAAADAELADQSQWKLAASPAQTVPWLRTHVQPVPAMDAAQIDRLIADLESAQFEARQQAGDALAKLAELAEPALRKRLGETPPLEVRQRIDQLLDKLGGPVTDRDRLRALRAVEVLERIGSKEARAVLQTLAGGAAAARLTQEAQGALQRLDRR